jgi:hypothetical protein
MSTRLLVAVIFFLAAPIAQAGQYVHVQGALIWTDEKQTITDCKSRRVYWVRVLASNPNFLLTKKVDELTSKGAENIVAELRGEVKTGIPSAGPRYPVDGTLNVHQIISVARGSCER